MEVPEMPIVLTIGHSNRTWKDFLERTHRVKRVIELRSIPQSRHDPQFNRETCLQSCEPRGSATCICESGGLRHARRDSPNMGWRNTSFRGFADYVQTSEFEAGLHRLSARRLISSETHQRIFSWVLERLAQGGLVRGKTIGVDSTTLEANAP